MSDNMAYQHTAETLYEEYKQDVFRYVMTILRNHHSAEDVTQEVFLSVSRFISQYRGEASIKTWIFAIAKHAAIKYDKENYYETSCMAEQLMDPAAVIEESMGFYDILAFLDQPARDVVAMHLAGNLKHREIAAITGETESAVKKRYSRALKQLGQHMKKEVSKDA